MPTTSKREPTSQSVDNNDLRIGSPDKRESRGLRAFDRLIFMAILLVISLTTIPYGTVEPWWEAAFECSIFILVGLWIVEGLWQGIWGINSLGMLIPLGVILAYAILQTIPLRGSESAWPTISADPYATRLVALKFLALVCTGLLLARYTSSRRRLRAAIYMVIVVAVASSIFGIMRETTQHNSPGFGLPLLMPGVGYGQFINRNHFAYLMELALGLALGLMVGKGEDRSRLLYAAAALPLIVALVLANSRGGILSLFSEVIFLLLIYGAFGAPKGMSEDESGIGGILRIITSKRPVRVLLIICLLAAMIFGVLWIGGDPLAKRLETIKNEVSSEDADTGEGGRRLEIWRASWRVFKAHPITGVGFGGYWIAITEYYDVPGQKRPYQAHNEYLELLVTGGIVGGALGVWFAIAFLKKARDTIRTKDSFRRAASLGALTGLFGIAVHSIVDFGLHITVNALVAIVLIVIATSEAKGRESNGSSERFRSKSRLSHGTKRAAE